MKNKPLFSFALFCLFLAVFLGMASAQTQVAPFTNSRVQFFNVGVPCSGCLLDTFAAGTTTPLVTYSESTGTTPNSNPVVLASDGSAVVYLTSAAYKLRLRTAAGVTLWTQDAVTWSNLAQTLNSLALVGNATINSSTAATSGANQSGPTFCMNGNFWNGSASAVDSWCWNDVLGTGTNPTSTLTLVHSGSSGTPTVSLPAVTASSVSVSGAETSQTDNQVLQVNKFATGGTGTVGSPWTSASGSGGLFEALTAAGTADGGNARLHMPAGFYSWTTCANGTANVTNGQGNSPPPTPLMIDGDGPSKTVIVGSTGSCGLDVTGRTLSISELSFVQGATNKSTIFVLMGRATNNTSSFPAGNVVKHVVCTLATNLAANNGNGTACIYDYAAEGTHFTNNSMTADFPYVATSNNSFAITSAYQTQNTSLRFVSQNVFEDGSCTVTSNSGACILLQGHAANTTIRNVSGECSAGVTAPFLTIKAPTTPDNATDPLAGLNIQNEQAECVTSGKLIVNEQILAAPKIHGTITNLAATPIITLSTASAQMINPEINLQASNTALTEPLISDAGAATNGIVGGTVYLPATTTIALTNASSGCSGTTFISSYASPSITCNAALGGFKHGIFTDTFTINSTGINTYNSNTNHTFSISGASVLVLNGTFGTFSKPLALTEQAAPIGFGGLGIFYADSTSHTIKSSYNNGSYFNVPQTIGSGTATMTTAAITAGNCGTTVTVAATGVATTDTITWAFNAAPAGTNAGLVAWPTANNVNFAYCSNTAETPAAATINWRVVR